MVIFLVVIISAFISYLYGRWMQAKQFSKGMQLVMTAALFIVYAILSWVASLTCG